MEWTGDQLAQLTHAAHHHCKPGVRIKALAVLAVARGYTREHAAEMFDTTRVSVGKWVGAFHERGVDAFEIAPGRGRPKQVDEEELKRYALQSPRNFGVNRSRWTLRLLAQTVPSLAGFTDAGVLQALRRCAISFKRGQPWLHSPDLEYEKKTN